jgi:hypothetical protein
MSKEHEECRHCSHCKKCRANCFKKHQTPEESKQVTQQSQTSGDFPSRKAGVVTPEVNAKLSKLSDTYNRDFCLSDMDEDTGFYRKKDVKEFVRRLDEFILQKGVSVYGSNDEALAIVNSINRELKKLAGSKLV